MSTIFKAKSERLSRVEFNAPQLPSIVVSTAYIDRVLDEYLSKCADSPQKASSTQTPKLSVKLVRHNFTRWMMTIYGQ